MLTHGADPARVPRLERRRRAARGRPLPDRQSVLPRVRVQGGLARVADDAARRSFLSPCSTSRAVFERVAARAASRCSPVRRRCTRRSSTTPTAASTTSRACASRSRARRRSRSSSSCACASELTLRDDHHRLRAHRVLRHRDHVPLRRRPRDDRHHVRPRHPRRRGARGRRRRRARCRAASRARSWSAATT